MEKGPVFGGSGPLGWFREWVTAHPKVDPNTTELILYHNTFIPPFVNYSIVPSTHASATSYKPSCPICILYRPMVGIASAKMMHDFGVSRAYTVILDLPISLNPLHLLKNRRVIDYNPKGRSRFGVFPHYRTQDIQWFETNPCCIFHTANTWQTAETKSVSMLCYRLTSAVLIYAAGSVTAPTYDIPPALQEEEQCYLYCYEFELFYAKSMGATLNQWTMSATPFGFPILRHTVSMSAAKYIHGCSVGGTSFGVALGGAVQINALVNTDVETLTAKDKRSSPTPIKGCVDERDMDAILASGDRQDPIKIFKLPVGHCTQEPRFVPRRGGTSEDDGWLVTYVFDESTQLSVDGEPKENAYSEL
ncbi:MAG: hypothetical protein LQ339_007598 [Xanthoria mediterranea]|nr:MAG: hypothetical protein LQ339_007598 [Xanthoria mediterranea]